MSQKVDEKGQVIITGVTPNPEGVDVDEAELLGVVNGTARLFKKMQINEVKYDGDKHWLRVNKKDNNIIDPNTGEPKLRRFFVEMTELFTPNPPTIATVNYVLVSGAASVTITPSNSGGTTTKYKIGDGAWQTGTSFSLDSGYANNKNNAKKTFNVTLKAIKNGEESDEQEYTITITPKVAAPSVSHNNTDPYKDTCKVTFTQSPTKDADTYYSTDGGATWTKLTSNTLEITEGQSQPAGKYQIKAVKQRTGEEADQNHTPSDVKSLSAITLDKMYVYYGVERDIEHLPTAWYNNTPARNNSFMKNVAAVSTDNNDSAGVRLDFDASDNAPAYVCFLTTDSTKAGIYQRAAGLWNLIPTTKTAITFTTINGQTVTYYRLISGKLVKGTDQSTGVRFTIM